jgi:ArsR family transcriptional regulator
VNQNYCDNENNLNNKCKELANIFKLLSNPTRLGILCIVCDQEVSVNDISSVLGKSQSNISQHLSVLRNTNMVDFKREDNKLLYFLKNTKISQLIKDIKDVQKASDLKELKISQPASSNSSYKG